MANPAPLRLGLEIEAVFIPKALEPGGKRLKAAEFAAQLAEGFKGKPGLHTAYKCTKYVGDKYAEWEIVRDMTMRQDETNMTYPLEITSPILTFDEQGNWHRQVIELFDHLETKCDRIVTNKSCGFHVHLSPGDGGPWKLDELQRICLAIRYFEGAFLALLPVSRRVNSKVNQMQCDNPNFAGLSIKEC